MLNHDHQRLHRFNISLHVVRKSWLTLQVRLLIFSLVPLVVLTAGGYLLFMGIHAEGRWSIPAVSLIVLCIGAFALSFVLGHSVIATIRNLTERVNNVMSDQHDAKVSRIPTDALVRLERTVDTLINRFEEAREQGDVFALLNSEFEDMHLQLSGLEDTGDVVQRGSEFVSRIMDLNEAFFYLVDDAGDLSCIHHFPDHVHPDSELRISQPDDQVEKAIEKKSMLFSRIDPTRESTKAVPSIDQANLITLPIMWKGRVQGIMTLERSEGFSPFHFHFAKGAAQIIGVALGMVSALVRKADLLKQVSRQKENIDLLQATLSASMTDLEDQHRAFDETKKKLRLKQLETEAANAQMKKNASDLEAHMAILEKQNAALETARMELEEKAHELEITSQYKTSFLANMSHELRTPLNSILLLSRLLQENEGNPLTGKRLEFVQTIHSAGEDLLNLIDEVLDLATVESGKLAVNLTSVTIRSIADTMAEIFLPLAEQKKVAFSTHVAPEVPERVITDGKRIGQIVKNFLSNAFKFTEKGSVTLEIGIAAKHHLLTDRTGTPNHDCITIAVMDTGIGVPSDKIQVVFEAFEQVDGSTRRKYGGTGLGLSISRQLAQLLGGDITLESKEGEGSCFTLYLPIIREEDGGQMIFRSQIDKSAKLTGSPVISSENVAGNLPADADMEQRSFDNRISAPALTGKTILLVDDDMRTVFALSKVLEAHGAIVLVGKTGKESLNKLRDFPEIDLVIMDVMITGIDGYKAIRTIRGRKEYRNLPIIALTTKTMKGDRSKCIMAEANDYLSKPVNLDVLMNIINARLASPTPNTVALGKR